MPPGLAPPTPREILDPPLVRVFSVQPIHNFIQRDSARKERSPLLTQLTRNYWTTTGFEVTQC